LKFNQLTFIALLILNSLQINCFGQINFHNLNKLNSISKNTNPIKSPSNNASAQIEINKFISLLVTNIENVSNNNQNQLNNFQIISDTQFRSEDKFIAEGNVVIQNGSAILLASKFEYNYKSKKISLFGNIKFNSEEQFFEASEFKFDFKNKTGFIKDVFGSVNFDSIESLKLSTNIDNTVNENLFEDTKIKNVTLNSTSTLGFEELDLKDEGTFFKKVTSQKFILDFKESQEWRFKTDRIDIKDNKWFSDELILTNDPFNKPQLLIKNKGFSSVNSNGEITIKSNWSTIVLENKLLIPTGPRSYKFEEDSIFRWGVGYDNDAKDGFFITRNFDTKYFGKQKKASLNIKKEFLLQRALKGKTESFSNKNESVIAAKSQRDAKFLDYFGLEGNLKTNLNKFNFNSDFSLNSLDLSKFKKSFTNKSEISTILNSKNQINSKKETKLSLFGNYRDKVWNGSLGEKEIISAYGLKINKSNIWVKNNVIKSSTIAASYGDYQSSDRVNPLTIINRERLNIFLDRSHSYPVWRPDKSFLIDKENIYSPLVIQPGLNFNAQAKIDLYRYNDNNKQDLFILRAGPELILGNFKKKVLDFTKIGIFQKTTLANGKSPFGFDQSTDNNAIEFYLKQQLVGPLTIDYKTEYNLDVNSPNYKKFFNTRYDLTWNRRAYSVSIYYNDETNAGGFNFKINSFNFDGYGENFD
tara:strand:+ start:740 stop:2833 length:2094 start_codon:yes stop_codon:yes gene_type:complete